MAEGDHSIFLAALTSPDHTTFLITPMGLFTIPGYQGVYE
jgi:hypothetical protein